MIYGVEASGVAAHSSPGGGALTPIISADFAGGVYTLNGSTIAATDLIGNVSTIVGGQGLLMTGGDPVIEIVGDLKTTLLTMGWTLIFGLNIDPNAHNFILSYETVASGYENTIEINTWGDFYIQDQNNQTTINRYCDYYDVLTSGNNNFGVTRTDDLLSSSINGTTPDAGATPPTSDTTHSTLGIGATRNYYLGGYSGDTITASGGSFYIKSLAVYDPVSNAQLATLTV